MPSSTLLESEITKWLVGLIESEKLFEAIENRDEIEVAAEAIDKRVGIPAFGFDHLSRRANVRAAAKVLSSLTLLDIVAVDKSISLTTGEVLRPDVLCFNPETRTLVVIEVKRDKLTERQAVTELAGYEQELRNALPFLGDFDVTFVVVATHWDALLNHAVANFNTWSGKSCLALKVSANRKPFTAACHLPNAWQLRGSSALPQEALQSVDLCLYEEADGGDEQDDENLIPPELITAVNLIARSGDRREAHGFAMLWRDSANLGNGKWSITLCGVDPIGIYAWCNENGLAIRASKLTEYLNKHVADWGSQVPGSLVQIAKDSFPVLGGKYRPMFETFCTWEEKLSELRRRATPVYFEFWGTLGDYARDFVCHDDVRERYIPFIDRHGLDWTHPDVAFPLIGNICGDIPFPDGLVRCSDAFKAGVRLGLHEVLARIADESEVEGRKLAPLLRWTMLEATRLAIEMAEIYRSVAEVEEPPPPLSEAPGSRASSVAELCDWVVEQLIGVDHPVHVRCFELGRRGAPYFSDWLAESEREEFVGAHAGMLVHGLLDMLVPVLSDAQSFEAFSETPSELRTFLRKVGIRSAADLTAAPSGFAAISQEDLLTAFRDHGAAGLNEVVHAVHHTVVGVLELAPDWGSLKESVRQIFEGESQWPAVILSQNGSYGVGRVDEQYAQMMEPIKDPAIEVYFYDQKASFGIWVKLTWSELQKRLAPNA